MSLHHSPKIAVDGLVLYLDAGNPKSYPRSGNTWLDLSGYNNHGTLINGVGYTANNKGSLVFDGVNDYISIAYTPILTPTSQISFGAWAYESNWYINSDKRILSKTQNGGYQIRNNELKVVGILLWVGGTYRELTVPSNTLSNGWHYIICTFNGRYIFLYIDGLVKASYDHGSSTVIGYSSNNHLVIGAELGDNINVDGQFWDGNISNVQIYNRALSADEVKQNFNALRGRYGI